MTTLTPEERALGRTNANIALGVTRRDFLKAAAAVPALGAFYFGYEGIDKPVRAAIIGRNTNDAESESATARNSRIGRYSARLAAAWGAMEESPEGTAWRGF